MANFKKIDENTFEIILNDEEKKQWEEEEKLYCSCEEEEKKPIYVENYNGIKHGWLCGKCKKFVQIG